MRKKQRRADPLRTGDAPPPLGEGTSTWHQSFEAAKTYASCALVWIEVLRNRIHKVQTELRKCHKWEPNVFKLHLWTEQLVADMKSLDSLYGALRPQEPGTGEKPEGGGGPKVDGLPKDVERPDVNPAQPFEGAQREFGAGTYRHTDGLTPRG